MVAKFWFEPCETFHIVPIVNKLPVKQRHIVWIYKQNGISLGLQTVTNGKRIKEIINSDIPFVLPDYFKSHRI